MEGVPTPARLSSNVCRDGFKRLRLCNADMEQEMPNRQAQAGLHALECDEIISPKRHSNKTSLDGYCENLVITVDDDSETEDECTLLATVLQAPRYERPRPLRISAGRVAAAAGLHPFVDVGELFLDLLYQDLPGLLTQDAALVGVDLIDPVVERARLLSKSGEVESIQAAFKQAQTSFGVDDARSARELVGRAIELATSSKRLTAAEGVDLRKVLEQEINQDFGTRHEDAALDLYQVRTGLTVYGKQQRIRLPFLKANPQGTQSSCLAHEGSHPKIQNNVALTANDKCETMGDISQEDAFFLLTGFIDGLVDVIPSKEQTFATHPTIACNGASETVVVEVKHRMNRVKDPPEIYDIIQLSSYCRALGHSHGDLVQCLRTNSNSEMQLLISRLDFSEGSSHRQGWDNHVLPGLYAIAAAVYRAREDEGQRYQLLAATPEERVALVGVLCPHLAR